MKIVNKAAAVIPSAARASSLHSLLWRNLLFTLAFLFLSVNPASAQVATGTPPFGSLSGNPDVINLGNLNAHWTTPVLHKAGRGLDFNFDLNYDSSVWTPVTSNGTTTWQPAGTWGWTSSAFKIGNITRTVTIQYSTCYDQHHLPHTETTWSYSGWTYIDAFGTSHRFPGTSYHLTGCTTSSGGFTATAIDGSGYSLTAMAGGATLYGSDGALINAPISNTGGSGSAQDRNGNQISYNSTTGVFTDTLGSTALTIAGAAPNPVTYSYQVPSGAAATVTVIFTTYSIQTNFGCTNPNIGEFGTNGTTTANLVTEIRLPDWNQNTNPNSHYVFAYEDTPGHSGFKTGRLASVTLPTGGVISYTYIAGGLTGTDVGSNDPIACADGSTPGLQRVVNDGTTSNTWTYARSRINVPTETNHWQTKITTPLDPANSGSVGNDTVIDFQKDSATSANTNNFYETQRVNYQGASSSNVALQTANTCYGGAASPCNTTTVTSPISRTTVVATIPSGGSTNLVSKNDTFYNTVGGSTELDEYAFGSGAPPATPARRTLITYASLGNITAFRQQVSVYNGTTLVAETNNYYDQTTPTNAPSGTPQLVSVSGSRGNLTAVARYIVVAGSITGSIVPATTTYDTAGQIQTITDALNNQTGFSYADKFDDDNGANPPQAHASLPNPTDAYVTSVSLPTGNSLKYRYYYYSGQRSTATDQNQNAGYAHFDSIGRLSSAYGPWLAIAGSPSPGNANPWIGIQYTSLTQVDTFTDINDTSLTPLTSCPSTKSCRQDEVKVDGLGRAIHGYLLSDPEGQTTVDKVYDPLGRVQSASHPYRNTNDTTYGTETPIYDALGRTTKITHQDTTYSLAAFGANVTGSNANTSQLCSPGTYGLGYPSLFTDESGRQREIWADAFGRTIEADEPDSNGSLKNSYVCYQYDPLDNLLSVVHSSTPSQTRSYGYDGLSRVTSLTIPELANSSSTNCAVTFTYDNNSNVQTRVAPQPNQNGSCSTGQVTTTYSYDKLNRLTKIQYSDGTTPTVQYAYDGGTLSGCTVAPPSLSDNNKLGTRTAMCDGSGATSWAHDALGRIVTEKRTIISSPSNVTQTLYYSYNLDGSIYSITYPSGKVVNYTVSNAQRLLTAKDSSGSPQYALLASYAPTGALQGTVTGQISGGFSGINECHSYNSSLEYTSTKATSNACSSPATGTTMDLGLQYNLNPPSGGQDNGTVTQITNNIDNLRTETLSYDPLNRITQAKSQATSGTDCWGQNFAPDALANLNTISNAQCTNGTLSVSVDANNHINSGGFAYDAAGNMNQDDTPGVTYTFDAENRLIKVTGVTNGPWCYFYDGNGLRVAKMSNANSTCTSGTYTTLYWRFLSGSALAETDNAGNTQNEYVFFAGRRIASRDGSGHVFYYFADQLGSTRTITTGSGPGQTPGQLCYDQDYTPYGQEVFTPASMTRLQTTACPPNYRFTGYEYDSETGLDYAFARYYSPRLGRFLSTDPLGGFIGNLQSHNAYAYVINNPLNLVDALGLDYRYCVQLNPSTYNCNTTDTFEALVSLVRSSGAWIEGGKLNGSIWMIDPTGMGVIYIGYYYYFTPDPNGDGNNGGGNNGGRGGGGGLVGKLKAAYCSAVPSGRVSGVNGSLGGVGSVSGSFENVVNYNSGQSSFFVSGGLGVGWNGGASGSVFTGYLWGLGNSNSNYSGGFTTVSGGAGIGGFISRSSGGLTGPMPSGLLPSSKGVTAAGVSLGASLVPTPTGGVSFTNYSQPFANVNGGAFFNSLDTTLFLLRRPCK